MGLQQMSSVFATMLSKHQCSASFILSLLMYSHLKQDSFTETYSHPAISGLSIFKFCLRTYKTNIKVIASAKGTASQIPVVPNKGGKISKNKTTKIMLRAKVIMSANFT